MHALQHCLYMLKICAFKDGGILRGLAQMNMQTSIGTGLYSFMVNFDGLVGRSHLVAV